LAKKFAKILFNKSYNEMESVDFIAAAPLHYKKLRSRKFNQAILLVKELLKHCKTTQPIFLPDILVRKKHTIAQIGLRKQAREQNLQNAFEVKKKYQNLIKDKKILLIDDVITTGATLNNCAKAFKKYGAKEVIVLTIAKTVIKSPT
jgi:ComF family protein